jgi:hypothetical protein
MARTLTLPTMVPIGLLPTKAAIAAFDAVFIEAAISMAVAASPDAT